VRSALASLLVVAAGCAPRPVSPHKLEALWYSVRGEQSVQSFVAHADQISIVSPQVFSSTATGSSREASTRAWSRPRTRNT
jgi:hypothetical protein